MFSKHFTYAIVLQLFTLHLQHFKYSFLSPPFQSFSRQIVFMWRQALKSGGSNNNEYNMGNFMLCANLQTPNNEERT